MTMKEVNIREEARMFGNWSDNEKAECLKKCPSHLMYAELQRRAELERAQLDSISKILKCEN